MPQYMRQGSWPFALALLSALAACGGEKAPPADALAQDSSLTRDLARVGGDTAVQPQLQDIPPVEQPAAEPAPVVTKPTPARARPKPPTRRPTPTPVATTPRRDSNVTASGNTSEKGSGMAERTGSISSGTTLSLGASDRVCTNTNKVGDRFVATVTSPVSGSNGATIPVGAAVTIEVTELKRSENANDKILMGFRVVNIAFDGHTYPLDADVQTATIDRIRNSSGGNDTKKVLGGAVAGAVIGQILGKKTKGTLIGAAAGAAAGGAAAAATANYEGCVNSGNSIVVRLNSPISVSTRA